MRLRISDPADRDIKEIHAFGIRTYGERRADDYIGALLDQLRWLADWPLTSREQDDIRPPVRLCIFDAHNIIYDVHPDEIVILRIFHHSADWKQHL
jgi:toxin ParE1/3/4